MFAALAAEDGAGWRAFLRGLVARGLAGVQLVISDARPNLPAFTGLNLHLIGRREIAETTRWLGRNTRRAFQLFGLT